MSSKADVPHGRALLATLLVTLLLCITPARSQTTPPPQPDPAIVSSIQTPQIIIDKVIVAPDAAGLSGAIAEDLKSREGQAYSAGQDSQVRAKVQEQLDANGYLEAEVDIAHDAPRRDGDRYLVNLLISVKPGRQYRISSITAGGGPLLPGKDFSSSFAQKTGEVAGRAPFGRVPADLRAYYERYGYADVEIHETPQLDRKQALVAYRLDVTPGPVYYLRSVTILNLTAEQESKVRALLSLKAGDLFDQTAINALFRKIPTDPLLRGYSFTFSPKKEKAAALVDLSLDFYRTSGTGNLILH